GDRFSLGALEPSAAAERVEQHDLVVDASAHAEMARQADALDLQADSPADLHDEHREGDRYAEAAVEDVVETALARIVVVGRIPAKADLVEQDAAHSLQGAAAIAHLRGGRAPGQLVETLQRRLRYQVGMLDARHRQGRAGQVDLGGPHEIAE